MPKKGRRQNSNFRQTKSERSATQSYRNFGSYIKGKIRKITFSK